MPTPPFNPTTYPTQRRGTSGPETAASGGAVSSVFGRIGAVLAVLGDYTSSLVSNTSTVAGTTVSDALDWLAANAGTVASVFGRTGVVTAQTGDYTTSQVDDASNLPGTTASDSLNYLGGQTVATATGATPNLDFAVSRYYLLTLNANCSPTMTVPPAGVEAVLEVVQGASAFTLTMPAIVDVQTVASGGGAPNISTVNGVRNVFKFLSNGTRLRLIGIGEY